MTSQIRSFLIPFVTLCIIIGVAATIIAYGRGYRMGVDGSVKPTGLMVVQSEPSGAHIVIDDKVKTATQATISLPPGWYNVTIEKDGFQSWHKKIKVQGEVVAKIEALLLPTNPSLTALTTTGVLYPALSPDGGRLAYVIPENGTATSSGTLNATRPGVWILDLVDKPLGLNRDARQIAKSTGINFSKAALSWSPDSKQILASFSPTSNYLLEADQINESPVPINNIKLLQNEWKTIKEQRIKEQFLTVPKPFTDIATSAASLIAFSPDETKILYEATASATIPDIILPPVIGANSTEQSRAVLPGMIYVYDVKEDKNFLVAKRSDIQNLPDAIHWLPTSRHLVVVGKTVEIMDYDAGNKRTAYGGPFWDSFAVPWASGGKLVILTNLNSAASTVNNLYIVNLR